MSRMKDMIETIIITEITRLYEKASTPLGLSGDETKKLKVYVEILEVFDDIHDNSKNENKPKFTPEELLKLVSKQSQDDDE